MNEALSPYLPYYLLGAAALAGSLPRLKRRLELSRAKHPSLAGHSKWSRRIARWLPYYEYEGARFYCADDAPAEVVQRRREGFERLAATFQARQPRTLALTRDAEPYVSDLQFTAAYRVPYPFSRHVRAHLKSGAFAQAADGVSLIDLDGNAAYDLAGSYGVNVFGYDFYRGCMERGAAQARELGPVLGAYHPLLLDNVRRLVAISGLDEVSFHMSGTEAVMQAVRLARYHTRRSHLVRFCGAYHGWWGDVQPGVGNPLAAEHTYTLKDMDADSLHVLRTRRDIACVLVNPLQALHPNTGAPGDSSLVDASRRAGFDRPAYTEWLRQLRAVCTARGIVLIFDEVFLGFRLAPGGAQAYFGVRADLVTYGKTLGGGFPVGVVCGRRALMKRFREDRPADICFARGTFNSHPYVMAAMNEFLRAIETPDIQAIYRTADKLWNRRAAKLNHRLREGGLPLQVANLHSVWTVLFECPSRYNWMLQFYLRAEGLALSWVGSGRFIFSLNYSEADFEAVARRILDAALKMQADGWWWVPEGAGNTQVKRRILREMLSARLGGRRS